MKTLNVMLKPASSLCNMRCRYCFYAEEAAERTIPSYGLMKEETVEALIGRVSEALQEGDAVQYIFQGGEPTLSGLPFFRRFTSLATQRKDISVSFSLQTNGLLLDEEFCDLLLEHRFLVGLSLDLLPEAHDGARKDAEGRPTYARVLDALSLLRRRSVPFNVLATLTPKLAKRPRRVYEQLSRLDIDFVQFTPCLCGEESSQDGLTPALFASFYTELFSLWYADYQKGKMRSIKLFDDIVNLLFLGRPTACGMDGVCRPQLVIEANGNAYPCDFFCTDEYCLGNIHHSSIADLTSSPLFKAFSERREARPSACEACRYLRFCGGGCPRMQREVYIPSEGEGCGYQMLLDAHGEAFGALAEAIRRSYAKNNR